MPLHLIKLAVGIRDVDHLSEVQAGRAFHREGERVVPGYTKRAPTRLDELVDGGSIYWVVKGSVRCRQRILALDMVKGEEGEAWCRLILDPGLVLVSPVAKRPFQGWRYLAAADAPRDVGAEADGSGDELPPHLLAELRALGLA
jgi:hypothetical protein